MDWKQELLMVSTVVGHFLRETTENLGALVATMATLVDITFRYIESVAAVRVHLDLTIYITLKQSKSLCDEVRSIIEHGAE